MYVRKRRIADVGSAEVKRYHLCSHEYWRGEEKRLTSIYKTIHLAIDIYQPMNMTSLTLYFTTICTVLMSLTYRSEGAFLRFGPEGLQLGGGADGSAGFLNIPFSTGGVKINSAVAGGFANSLVNVPMVQRFGSRYNRYVYPTSTSRPFARTNCDWYYRWGLPYSNLFNGQTYQRGYGSSGAQWGSQTGTQTASSVNSQSIRPWFFNINRLANVQVTPPNIPMTGFASSGSGCSRGVDANGQQSISAANGVVNLSGQSISCK
ncbi:unnamed protein product [Adineta ricciae]|uniref:Uncharacterized protein n=1 Tax=Adineta ricciae TaxID=249248 RepID=A0A813MY90_ADIRI|nr:unnamed protein product [Adineta ricciae]